MRQTGHKRNAVGAYKRPMAEHNVMVSKILQPPSPKKGRVSDDDGEPEPGIENQVSSFLLSGNDTLNSILAKKGVSMTFNFHFK